MATTLRQALTQRLSKNSEEVVKALKSSGMMLSKEEENSLMKGSLEGFSDQALDKRFNAKVLGMLGMSMSSMGSSMGSSKSSKKEKE